MTNYTYEVEKEAPYRTNSGKLTAQLYVRRNDGKAVWVHKHKLKLIDVSPAEFDKHFERKLEK